MAKSGSKTVEIFSWIDLKFSWWENSQSVVNNTTTIGWKLEAMTGSSGAVYVNNRTWTVTIDGTKYTGTIKVSLDKSSSQVLASGTADIKHNDDGSKTFAYSFSQQFNLTLNSGKYMGTYSGSGSDTLDNISRRSTISAPDGTLETAQTITVSQNSTSFKHSILAVCGSESFYIKADGTTSETEVIHNDCSIPWTPPIELAYQATQNESVTITFTITTYSGSTAIGTATDTAAYSIPEDVIAPLSFVVTDTSGYYNQFGGYVQGKSNLVIDMTTYGAYGAWIKSYEVSIGGNKYTSGTKDGIHIEVDTGAITKSGSVEIVATVVDSRNRTTTAKATKTILEYEHPTIKSLSAYRTDEFGRANASGSYLTVKFSSEISSLNNSNQAFYTVAYKKNGATRYTEESIDEYAYLYLLTNELYTFPADDSSYDIELRIQDSFRTVSQSVTGASVSHTISLMKKNGKIVGMAINKLAEIEGVFDLGFPLKLSAGLYDDGSLASTDEEDEEADRIVACGETDGWLWRKWESGRAECRKTVTVSTAISTAWGTMYVGTTKMSRQSYPFVFTAKPMEVASLASAANAVWLFPESGGNGINGAYQSAIYNVCRPSAVSAASTYYITIDAVGKWK